jgi:ribosomal protein L39E
MQYISERVMGIYLSFLSKLEQFRRTRLFRAMKDQRGDVPGWVLVVLMTTGLVTAIWTIAAPRLSAILRNSLDSMNGIR